MRLSRDPERSLFVLTAHELASFARSRPGGAAGVFFPASEAEPPLERSVPLSLEKTLADGPSYLLTAAADAAVLSGGEHLVSFTKEVRRDPKRVLPTDDPVFLAECFVSAYLYSVVREVPSLTMRLVFASKSAGLAAWERPCTAEYLSFAAEALLARALPFLRIELARRIAGRDDLRRMPFPYGEMREGQRELMETLWTCVRRSERLLVTAPTGIGKTVSVLYPSLRSIGARRADRVFYFTAKTVTGDAALDALRRMAQKAPLLRGIRLSAKERLCPRRAEMANERGLCRGCPLLSFQEGQSYAARRDAALLELLEKNAIDRKDLLAVAAAHSLCPYELALDASEYCELIVCDYAYLIDPDVRLRRYFAEDRGEEYVFLFDEAHNLPDRAREIHSVRLPETRLNEISSEISAAFPGDAPLTEALEEFRAAWSELRELCLAEAQEREGVKRGFYVSQTVPETFQTAAAQLRAVCDSRLRTEYEAAAPYLEDLRGVLRRLAAVSSEALDSDAYSFLAEYDGNTVDCRLLCLDPAEPLNEALSHARSSVLFSATLSPIDYYADVCGCPDAERLELESPYDPANLCLVTVDSVSTRLTERRESADEVVEWVAAAVQSRPGNYIVYFPSYRYLDLVGRRLRRDYPDLRLIVQRQEMSLRERDRFLREFSASAESGDGVVALCVLGGVFSEGIDLVGEKLIGVVIVGIGLPGLSGDLNLLQEYYDRKRENGRAYAYVYPAVNRILQAAGRVIRDEDDRGVVILIDDRYRNPELRELFPSHWRRMRFAEDPWQLSEMLDRFWNEDGR